MSWKEWPHWVRGMSIALIIMLVIDILSSLSGFVLLIIVGDFLAWPPALIIKSLIPAMYTSMARAGASGHYALMLMLTTIFWTIIGTLIGLVCGLIKSENITSSS